MEDLFEIINCNDYSGRLIYLRNTGKILIISFYIYRIKYLNTHFIYSLNI